MKELINEYKDRMGWSDHSITTILMDYIASTEKSDHNCIPFRDYIEQRALDEEEQVLVYTGLFAGDVLENTENTVNSRS